MVLVECEVTKRKWASLSSCQMTTIAVNRYCMAADTQVDDEGIISHTIKLFRSYHDEGYDIIGFAGTLCEGLQFVEWYGEKSPDEDCGLSDDTSAVVLTSHGEIFTYESIYPMIITDPHYAIGSGAAIALAAMDCGHTPEEAIKIASKRDAYTGSETISVKINEE